MPRRARAPRPIVSSGILHLPDGRAISLDTPAWYSWLAQSHAFDVEGPALRFLVYREKRQRGQLYWFARAYKQGRKAGVYLGKSISCADLERASAKLQRKLDAQQPLTASRAATPPATSIAELRERLIDSDPQVMRAIVIEQLANAQTDEQRTALRGLLALIDSIWGGSSGTEGR